jgi:hypothetical protein
MSRMKEHMMSCEDSKCEICHPTQDTYINATLGNMTIGKEICIRVIVREVRQDKDGYKYTCEPVKGDGSEYFNSITIKPTAIVEIGE